MDFLIPVLFLYALFFGVPAGYYLYLWHMSSKSWRTKINEKHMPPVTIMIPAHNEEKTVGLKLSNLNKVEYPKDKMQVILIDDASSDETIREGLRFAGDHPELGLEIIGEKDRKGKSIELSIALAHAKHDIVIVTDADTFWSPDVLTTSLPFFSDPSIGAVSGRQILLGSRNSLLTKTEKIYLDLVYDIVKLGESKIHSTILFHGLFSAYSRKFLKGFNLENDDSGTALDIVQNGARTIYVPGAQCYELPPLTWKGKINTKMRRANQLIALYVRCLRLLLGRSLLLPLRIAVPEIFIYLINPILFPFLIVTTLLFLWSSPTLLLCTILVLFSLLAISSRIRLLFLEMIQDNFILLASLATYAFGRKFLTWETLEESRSMLSDEILKAENLI